MTTLERIEELKHNENLMYNLADYLHDLWSVNASEEEICNNFKNLGFTPRDIDIIIKGKV